MPMRWSRLQEYLGQPTIFHSCFLTIVRHVEDFWDGGRSVARDRRLFRPRRCRNLIVRRREPRPSVADRHSAGSNRLIATPVSEHPPPGWWCSISEQSFRSAHSFHQCTHGVVTVVAATCPHHHPVVAASREFRVS